MLGRPQPGEIADRPLDRSKRRDTVQTMIELKFTGKTISAIRDDLEDAIEELTPPESALEDISLAELVEVTKSRLRSLGLEMKIEGGEIPGGDDDDA